MKQIISTIIVVTCFIFTHSAYAQEEYSKDLYVNSDSVQVKDNVLVGDTVRIYATVYNDANQDIIGVVKFYNENEEAFIGSDQPVSLIAGKTDDVFVDWKAEEYGSHTIAVRVIPWEEEGDDPSNNKVTKVIYVDIDTDNDGIGNKNDNDDDNDGILDNQDSFSLNPFESEDTDNDGIGNNEDTDDDNDGISDIEDAFPLDSSETQDSDNDGIGDNSDFNSSNHSPIPQIDTADTNVSKGEIITFNALKSRDPDGEIVSYEWNLGDGIKKTGVVIDHVFKKTGSYNVILKTIDNEGEAKETQIKVKVTYKWQTICLIAVTILLIFLLATRKIIFGYFTKNSKKIDEEIKAIHNSIVSSGSKGIKSKKPKLTKKINKSKKNLPKK